MANLQVKRWHKSCVRHDLCGFGVAEVWSGAGKAEQARQSIGVSAIVGITDQTMVTCAANEPAIYIMSWTMLASRNFDRQPEHSQ